MDVISTFLLGGRGGTCSDGRPALEIMKHKLRLRRDHQKYTAFHLWIAISLQKSPQTLLLQNAQFQKTLQRGGIDRIREPKLVAVHNHLPNLRLLLMRHINRMLRKPAVYHVGAYLLQEIVELHQLRLQRLEL